MLTAAGADDVRTAEAATGTLLADGTLMERAAAALASVAAGSLYAVYGARVVLLVGSGDNGGDALLAGALLARRGARVDAVLLASSAHERGLAALVRAGGRAVNVDDARTRDIVGTAELVLDGITGIGGRGGLHAPAVAVLRHVSGDAVVVAVDLPSGVDADTGEVDGVAVHAHLTVSFGAAKPGLLVAPGASHAGHVSVVDIGLSSHLAAEPVIESLEAVDVVARWPRPEPSGDKYSRGVVGIAAGSDAYTGAGVLAVAGAIGAGAGMVRFVSEPAAAAVVRAHHPEAVVTDVHEGAAPIDAVASVDVLATVGRVQCWVVGPGGGTGDHAATVLRAALSTELPVVVDADGLTVLAERPDLVRLVTDRAAPTVLTPHAGELARLLAVPRSDVEARGLHHVREAASRFGAVVLLKGSATLVAEPGAPVRANPVAVPWLATAGSGDVLAGVIGALLAAGLGARDAASVGAWLHGSAAAAVSAGGPLRAGDLADALPGVVAALLEPLGAGDSTP